jgi:hypothetical protein
MWDTFVTFKELPKENNYSLGEIRPIRSPCIQANVLTDGDLLEYAVGMNFTRKTTIPVKPKQMSKILHILLTRNDTLTIWSSV